MRQPVFILLTSSIVFSVIAPVFAQNQSAQVVSVGDGDTLTVQAGGKKTIIRLACIDAPEMKQVPWGEQSRKRLQMLLPAGTAVSVKSYTTDKYGRTVAEIFKGQTNINLTLVQEGRAVVYREYLAQCDGSAYLKNESTAKSRRLAFWSQPKPVMPWDFRKGSTTAAKPLQQPKPAQQCDPNYTGACIPPYDQVGDLNCTDIAARRFQSIGSDPHGFDRDGDGIACER